MSELLAPKHSPSARRQPYESRTADGEPQRRTCCSGSRPATVTDYFDLGLRRSRAGRLPINGETVTDRNGLHLQFDLDVCDGLIEQVTFKASTCITLVAYVEMLARRITGLSLFDATRVTPSELIVDLEQVPPAKQDRAVLAVRALQAAIVSATRDLFIEPSSKQGVSP